MKMIKKDVVIFCPKFVSFFLFLKKHIASTGISKILFICGKDDDMKEFYKGDVTYKIIGCAMNVHNEIGCGFQEVIYQRALFIEFRKAGLLFEREKEMKIHYQGEKIGTRRVDFLIDGDIMLEIKAITKMEDVAKAQLMNYLETYGVRVGLLINFGSNEMEYYRFIK